MTIISDYSNEDFCCVIPNCKRFSKYLQFDVCNLSCLSKSNHFSKYIKYPIPDYLKSFEGLEE